MCLVPALVILVIYGFFGWSLIVFVVAGLTDALDGVLARTRDESTELGRMLDPLADKLLVIASLITLSTPTLPLTVRMPVWVTILTISRDAGILITVVVINLAVGRKVFAPTALGKATTTVQLLAILWVFWGNYRGAALPLTQVLLVVMVGLTIISGFHYIHHARKTMGEGEAG